MTNAMAVPESAGLLTVKEAAEEYRLHPNTIRRLLRKGTLGGERIGGQWRVHREQEEKEMHQVGSKCNRLQH